MEINGTIEEIIYRNDENGYAVVVVNVEDYYVTAVGTLPYINEGDEIKASGSYGYHKTYGDQFKISSYEVVMPKDEEKIIKFLASSNIEGVGESTAKKIVNRFGKETLDILHYNPERLLEISGIGKSKLKKILGSYEENLGMRDTIMFLQSLHLGPKTVNKIIKHFGNGAKAAIEKNPFILYDLIDGIGFKKADEIASRLGHDVHSKFRIRAYIRHTIRESSFDGHTYILMEDFVDKILMHLDIEGEEIGRELNELIISGMVVLEEIGEEKRLYDGALFHAETNAAAKLTSLVGGEFEKQAFDFDRYFDLFAKDNGLALSKNQKDAVRAAIDHKVTVITGGPGTGKTTIVKCIIGILNEQGKKIKLAAPTGRASKRMEEATLMQAKTIHRLLEYQFNEEESVLSFGKNESDPLTGDVIIVDEVSMLDISLFSSLLDATVSHMQLILIGDVDQLPSVGPGKVLADLIDSSLFKTIRLTEIFRQSEDSLISVNAMRINDGLSPLPNAKTGDFFFMPETRQENILTKVKHLVSSRLPDYYKLDPLWDIQVLTPMKNGKVGTKQLNESLQEILNPPSDDKSEVVLKQKIFRAGDKVMQMKNNYNIKWIDRDTLVKGEGIFNGDIGYIETVDTGQKKVSIIYEDTKEVVYEFTDMVEVELAYAITIHKSQGSEFKAVVIPISFVPDVLSSRNLLYTGVTRGKRLVVIVGDEVYYKRMIGNKKDSERNTGLKERLRSIFDELKA